MSVLIKGMEMPESCSDCDFCSGIVMPDDIYFCDCPVIHGGLNITQAIEEDNRHPDCPLVEIKTPLGKLLDSDVVKKALCDAVDDISRGYIAVYGIEEDDIEGIIDSVPPVQPEIMSDGTLHVTVNADVANIDRILLSQAGTHSGDLYYKDDEKPKRKTGKWILADAYAGKRYRCSECLAFALKTDDGKENLSDYCPVCGMRMKKGEQE